MEPIRVKTITEGHRLAGLPKPQHPLISLVDCADLKPNAQEMAVVFDFYSVSVKRGCDNLLYGQQLYDFDEGVMGFVAPNQVLRGAGSATGDPMEGWIMFIHPDFLWNTPLAKKIRQFDFFGYAANEALFLSEKEETLINSLVDQIRQEYHAPIDKFSQPVIVAQLELLFTYAQRAYERQFITRKITNHQVLEQLETLLTGYFNDDRHRLDGLPTVQYLADAVHLSPKYLGTLLKQLTGQTAQQLIHEKLVEKAKEKLSTTRLSVAEIAYELGFEHAQSFSKLFKQKTSQTPLAFRAAFQ